jgi:glycosidase
MGDRDGVRTPMQWPLDRNGGFSRADLAKLFLPAIQDPVYGFSAVNVKAQLASPSSPLTWMRRIAGRLAENLFGSGGAQLLHLRVNALAVCRYPCIAVNHGSLMHRIFAIKKAFKIKAAFLER